MAVTLVVSLILGILLAFVSVKLKKTDPFLYGLMTVQAETPPFLLGVLLLFLVAAKVDWIPLSGAQQSFAVYHSSWDKWKDILVHSLTGC
jgi:peptide/nickel transport system permease protein